ncbi:AI-2E family transporter [soil metagenome]
MATEHPQATARHALVFWAIALAMLAIVVVVHVAAQTLLLAFFGILFATSLRAVAVWVAARLHVPVAVGLVLSLAAMLALSVGAWIWLLPRIIDQASHLVEQLTVAYHDLHDRLEASSRGREALDELPALGDHLGYAARATGVIASTLGVAGSLLFTVFTTIYLAAAPDVYRRGVLRLMPPAWRTRAGEVLDDLGGTLRRWLLGRLVSMTAVGIVTAVGLYLLGIPLPVALGLMAGAFGFVPNVGPIVSTVPALLLATTIGFDTTLYVAGLYLTVNLVDGFVLTPLLQNRAVSTPAALVLASQLVAGALWGLLGIMAATPLTACMLVIVRRVYVARLERDAPVGTR